MISTRTSAAAHTRPLARAAVLLAAVALVVTGLGPARGAVAQDGRPGTAKPTVVLVHGAWADSSNWSGVIPRLQQDGYTAVAVANPLRSLSGDAAYVRTFLETVTGPIVLAGHSYGGAVITNAATGNPNVKALVYVAALIPDAGETGAELLKFPGSLIVLPPSPEATSTPLSSPSSLSSGSSSPSPVIWPSSGLAEPKFAASTRTM